MVWGPGLRLLPFGKSLVRRAALQSSVTPPIQLDIKASREKSYMKANHGLLWALPLCVTVCTHFLYKEVILILMLCAPLQKGACGLSARPFLPDLFGPFFFLPGCVCWQTQLDINHGTETVGGSRLS